MSVRAGSSRRRLNQSLVLDFEEKRGGDVSEAMLGHFAEWLRAMGVCCAFVIIRRARGLPVFFVNAPGRGASALPHGLRLSRKSETLKRFAMDEDLGGVSPHAKREKKAGQRTEKMTSKIQGEISDSVREAPRLQEPEFAARFEWSHLAQQAHPTARVEAETIDGILAGNWGGLLNPVACQKIARLCGGPHTAMVLDWTGLSSEMLATMEAVVRIHQSQFGAGIRIDGVAATKKEAQWLESSLPDLPGIQGHSIDDFLAFARAERETGANCFATPSLLIVQSAARLSEENLSELMRGCASSGSRARILLIDNLSRAASRSKRPAQPGDDLKWERKIDELAALADFRSPEAEKARREWVDIAGEMTVAESRQEETPKSEKRPAKAQRV